MSERLTIAEQLAAEEAASQAFNVVKWQLEPGFMGVSYVWKCGECGAAVIDAAMHHAWHASAAPTGSGG